MAINVVLGESEESFTRDMLEDNRASWLMEDITYIADMVADACPDLTKRLSKKELKEAIFNQNCQIQNVLSLLMDVVGVIAEDEDEWTFDDEEGWSH